MPTATRNAGTEAFQDFDERRYVLRVVECKETTSPPPDNRPQYQWSFALEGSQDAESGREIVRRVWCSTIWNEKAEKESHLVLMARALIGPQVTFEEWEALGFDDLVGKKASALVALDAKGYPAIDKTTFRAAGRAAASRQINRDTGEVNTSPARTVWVDDATDPQGAMAEAMGVTPAAPAAPKRPMPPARPQAATAPLRTDAQRDRLFEAASAQEYDTATLTNWIHQEFPGKTIDTLAPEECESLIAALDGAPF